MVNKKHTFEGNVIQKYIFIYLHIFHSVGLAPFCNAFRFAETHHICSLQQQIEFDRLSKTRLSDSTLLSNYLNLSLCAMRNILQGA